MSSHSVRMRFRISGATGAGGVPLVTGPASPTSGFDARSLRLSVAILSTRRQASRVHQPWQVSPLLHSAKAADVPNLNGV